MRVAPPFPQGATVRLLDPAVGHGQLLLSLLAEVRKLRPDLELIACGFETSLPAIEIASGSIRQHFPSVRIEIAQGSFLDYVLAHYPPADAGALFTAKEDPPYDLVIANPPYVRTQIMGAAAAQQLSETFGLTGRIDLYHPFIIGMAQVLKSSGTAGIIVSNRFMTTKAGKAVRRVVAEMFGIHHVWDLGDTRLFSAAVLPAVLILRGKGMKAEAGLSFSSIYSTEETGENKASNPIEALSFAGIIRTPDGRSFNVQHGKLSSSYKNSSEPWRIATPSTDAWLAKVASNTWGTFQAIGKIRIGIKTCADSVFIRDDWDSQCPGKMPELLRPLMTHHVARRFRARHVEPPRMVLYPHEMRDGHKRAVDISAYSSAAEYLERYRDVLLARKYVLDAGRQWYELWVPQDPAAWGHPKLVFRDIAEHPTFWLDLEGAVVNGDCYWLVASEPANESLLWLAAAVANSTFAEAFYDHKFHNKLYAGRRRFMTQYVEQFPLPDPQSPSGEALMREAKAIYEALPSSDTTHFEQELDAHVWGTFGLDPEERCR